MWGKRRERVWGAKHFNRFFLGGNCFMFLWGRILCFAHVCSPEPHNRNELTSIAVSMTLNAGWQQTLASSVRTTCNKKLGVIFDLKCDKQINNAVKVNFLLCSSDQEKVIHAFMSARLDYCSTLNCGVAQSGIQQEKQKKNKKRAEPVQP